MFDNLIFAVLITLTENVQKKFQCNFCDQWNISFSLKSFYQIPLTWSKTYQRWGVISSFKMALTPSWIFKPIDTKSIIVDYNYSILNRNYYLFTGFPMERPLRPIYLLCLVHLEIWPKRKYIRHCGRYSRKNWCPMIHKLLDMHVQRSRWKKFVKNVNLFWR